MKLPDALLTRLSDVVDALFDAIASIRRVLLRGAFAPDAKSYRGARFAPLPAAAVLAQDLALNAADQAEARKAIALDPEAALPLAPEIVHFDIAGPLDAGPRPRARPERNFILGVVRKETLTEVRQALPAHRRGAVEGFIFFPPAQPHLVLTFTDEAGAKRRRLRRMLTAAAALIFVATALDALDASQAALTRAVAAADAERVDAERRIRLAERRHALAEAARASASAAPAITLEDALQKLTRIALHQPPETETTSAAFANGAVTLSGQSYDAEAMELQLRRAFEQDIVAFSAEPGASPSAFSVVITPPRASLPEPGP